jgi:hypothetical protein
MIDFYAKCEIKDVFYSSTSSTVFHTGASATKGERCPSCGRDTRQPNLLPPSTSRFFANLKDISRGHGICGQCGGLGAGLLDGLL